MRVRIGLHPNLRVTVSVNVNVNLTLSAGLTRHPQSRPTLTLPLTPHRVAGTLPSRVSPQSRAVTSGPRGLRGRGSVFEMHVRAQIHVCMCT